MKFKKLIAVALWIFIAMYLSVGTVEAAKEGISSLGSAISTQKKYTMYLGTNDKDTHKQKIPIEVIKEEMHNICIKYVDGYTLSIADGFYRDDDGNITHEVSLIYVFVDVPIDSIQKIMDEALIKFNQNSILLEESNERSIFYSGSKQ